MMNIPLWLSFSVLPLLTRRIHSNKIVCNSKNLFKLLTYIPFLQRQCFEFSSSFWCILSSLYFFFSWYRWRSYIPEGSMWVFSFQFSSDLEQYWNLNKSHVGIFMLVNKNSVLLKRNRLDLHPVTCWSSSCSKSNLRPKRDFDYTCISSEWGFDLAGWATDNIPPKYQLPWGWPEALWDQENRKENPFSFHHA